MTPSDTQNTPTTIISRLSRQGLLSVISTDNLKFLQGQFTCDLNEVNEEQWRYGALCTNKGRMISNFLLTQIAPNHHLLRMHVSTVEAVHNTLKKFVPFYKGTLNDVSAHYVIIGLAGENSEALVQTVFEIPLAQSQGTKTSASFTLIKLDDARYECWIKKECFETYWSKLTSSARVVDENQWDLLNIRAGLGEVRQATIEEWTPHMLNLQAIGAISFKKGCYTGQEIVARTEYRGQQKRAMVRVSGQGATPETAAPIMDGEKIAGEIVMAASSGEHPIGSNQWEALAVISDTHLDKPVFCHTSSSNNHALQCLPLPYSIKKKSPP